MLTKNVLEILPAKPVIVYIGVGYWTKRRKMKEEITKCPICGCSEPIEFVRDGICLRNESEKFLGIKLWNATQEKEFRKSLATFSSNLEGKK